MTIERKRLLKKPDRPEPNGEKSGRDQHGRFMPGNCANPAGRPKGSRNIRLMELEETAAKDLPRMYADLVKRALAGDATCHSIYWKRMWPYSRYAAMHLDLPPIRTVKDVAEAQTGVIAAMSNGSVTPDEAEVLSRVLTSHHNMLVAAGIEARLQAIEEQLRARATP